MWFCYSPRFFSEQVYIIPGKTDAIHPVFKTVLIQGHNRLLILAGKFLNPGCALKTCIRLPTENCLPPFHRCVK